MSIYNRFMPSRIAVGVLAGLLTTSVRYVVAQGEGANGGPGDTGDRGGNTAGGPGGDTSASPIETPSVTQPGETGGPADGGVPPPSPPDLKPIDQKAPDTIRKLRKGDSHRKRQSDRR